MLKARTWKIKPGGLRGGVKRGKKEVSLFLVSSALGQTLCGSTPATKHYSLLTPIFCLLRLLCFPKESRLVSECDAASFFRN